MIKKNVLKKNAVFKKIKSKPRIQKKKKFFSIFYKNRKAAIIAKYRFNQDIVANIKSVLNNKAVFIKMRKHRKFSKISKIKKLDFFFQFPRILNKKQPLTKFFTSNLELLAINYDLLLGFHTAIGNSYKFWINPAVFSSVLAIRDNMVLFDMTMIFVRLKKGLQTVFQVAKHRGSVLGFIDATNNYKFSGSGFEHFLRSWLGGYLTNFKFVTKNLLSLQKNKFMYLTRRQQKFFHNLVVSRQVSVKYHYAFFQLKKPFRLEGIPKKLKRRIPAVPQFGFCLEDHSIWLNESHKIGNNVMCVCDSESFPQQVDFPLIANQKSLPLNFFLVKIVTEALMCGRRMDYFSFWGFKGVASHRS